MPAFNDPGFQQRQESAARAKASALAQLRAKPPLDETVVAARTATRLAREAAEAEKGLARRLAREQAVAAKREQALEAAAKQAPAPARVLTEAERKAARDARYAARKSRKSTK